MVPFSLPLPHWQLTLSSLLTPNTRPNYDNTPPLASVVPTFRFQTLSLLRDGHVARFECRLDPERLMTDLLSHRQDEDG